MCYFFSLFFVDSSVIEFGCKLKKMHFTNKQCIFTTVGLGLVSLGVFLAVFWMDIFHFILESVGILTVFDEFVRNFCINLFEYFFFLQELALAPNTKSFLMWKNPPLSLNFDVYLFNWTNPRNLTADEYEKPILEQIGPYRFREKSMKTKVKWHTDNSTISYRRKSLYYFVEEESVGRLDDKITTVNAVAVVSRHLTITNLVFT